LQEDSKNDSEPDPIEMIKLERSKSYLSEPLLVDNYHCETGMNGDHLMFESSEDGREWWECNYDEALLSPRRAQVSNNDQ
jgi:hypothetical protein